MIFTAAGVVLFGSNTRLIELAFGFKRCNNMDNVITELIRKGYGFQSCPTVKRIDGEFKVRDTYRIISGGKVLSESPWAGFAEPEDMLVHIRQEVNKLGLLETKS